MYYTKGNISCVSSSKQARILTLAVGLGVVGLGVGGGVGGGVAQLPNVVDSLEANCPPPLTSADPSQVTLYDPVPYPQQMPSPNESLMVNRY